MPELTEEVEAIVPKKEVKIYTFGLDDHLTFTQRPLSFFGKIELIAILGEAVDKAVSEGGISVAELIEEVPDSAAVAEANNFVRSLARIAQYAPDFLKDLYCISLGVPRGERDYVKMVMELPEEEGGLSDDQGMSILETFIDQNWDVLLDFFKTKIVPMFQKLTKTTQNLESSTPSKATARRTPKQSTKSSTGPGSDSSLST